MEIMRGSIGSLPLLFTLLSVSRKIRVGQMKLKKLFGPSTLVAAAFIGPGTVTTCTIAGVTSGYTMLWSMLFSITATIVLQEMSARLGWATGRGLGEAIRTQFDTGIGKYLSAFLVIAAILIGNAAYEAGNLSGGILGLQLICLLYTSPSPRD